MENMNREIKIKVYLNNKLFGFERLKNSQWEWMVLELNPDSGERWCKGVMTDGAELTRVEWTGLKDKNGVEIYEGDISMPGNGEIYWCNKTAMFRVKWHDKIWKRVRTEMSEGEPLLTNPLSFEIVGNIYETPLTNI